MRDAYTEKNIFYVPKSARWGVIAAACHTEEIGKVIDGAMDVIEDENPKLKGVLPKNYASPDLDKDKLSDVVDFFTDEIHAEDLAKSKDLLGRTYEYCNGRKGKEMKTEQQNQILGCMNDVLNQNDFRAEIMQQEGAPTILRCEAMRQGKVAKDVVIEACFIPMQLPDENMGLLQFFVTLFQGAPEEHKVQLHRACDYCNGFCALGAFGFYEQAGQIYLKHNTLVDGSLELDKIIPFVADNISVLLAAVSRFIDGLAQVAYAGMTLDAVIDQELFPKMN